MKIIFFLVFSLLFAGIWTFRNGQLQILLLRYEGQLRPVMISLFGEEQTLEFFGQMAALPSIPAIPLLEQGAESTAIYQQEEQQLELSEEDQLRLNFAFIQELYFVIRNQPPTEEESRKWFNVLTQGASREGVYRALVLDQYYYSLENSVSPNLNSTVMAFGQDFLSRYLQVAVSEEAMKALNIYSFKRILVEKSLEGIDALIATNPSQLHLWYGLLSAELAKKYPIVFSNDVRRNTSFRVHEHWASQAPSQHLKSEVIIKINLVLNHLHVKG